MLKILFLFLLVAGLCNAQQNSLAKINFTEKSANVNPYIDMLKLNDKNALIIKSYSNEFTSSYVVLPSNGEIYHYGMYTIDGKSHTRKIKVAEAEKTHFLKLAEEINKLDATQLNRKEVTAANGTKSEISFNNYPDYYIEIFQGNQSVKFNSLAADGFIEAQAAGYQMREKLVTLYKALDFSETITTNPYETVKAKDTVYIRFKKGEFEQKQKIAGNDCLYDIAFGGKNHAYLLSKSKSPALIADNVFLEKHEHETIDYDFFLKYNNRVSFLHFRILYIIDETDASGKKMIIPISDFSII